MTFIIRTATVEDAEAASALVHLSFGELAAKDWQPEARQVFLGESSPGAIREKLESPAYSAAAHTGTCMVGFLLMQDPSLLGILFVHPQWLRQGIGRALWESARAHIESAFPQTKTVELNATPYSVAFYQSLGFAPISSEFQLKGTRATRMACWLPGRSLGAEMCSRTATGKPMSAAHVER
jgi:GNAT superfamily N-acetyltransferase